MFVLLLSTLQMSVSLIIEKKTKNDICRVFFVIIVLNPIVFSSFEYIL